MIGSAANFDWKAQRILVIDADDQFRFWSRGLFKHQRVAEIVSVNHPDEARTVLTRQAFDIALLELCQRETDTIRLLKWMRDPTASSCRKLPVILMVKTEDDPRIDHVCASGVHAVLGKSISTDQLLRAVSNVIRNPRLVRTTAFADSVAAVAKPRPDGAAATPPRPRPLRPPSAVAGPGGARPPVARNVSQLLAGTPGAAIPESGGLDGSKAATSQMLELAPGIETKPKRGSYDLVDDPPPVVEKAQFVEMPPRPSSAEAIESPIEELDEKPKKKAVKSKLRGFFGGTGTDESAAADKVTKPKMANAETIEPPAEEPQPPAPAAVPAPTIEEILESHAQWVGSGERIGVRAKLEGQDLSGRDLGEVQLSSALLRGADLSVCKLTGAQLQGADLRYADLVGSQLAGANLAVAKLRHARLRGCPMEGAILKGADLAGADLSGAKLGDADLAGANLLGTDLSAADLSGVSGLTRVQLKSTRGDVKTRLPPGLRLPGLNEEGG